MDCIYKKEIGIFIFWNNGDFVINNNSKSKVYNANKIRKKLKKWQGE